MASISVNPELVSEYGRTVTGLGTDYTTEINAIYTTIDELNNSWKGDAATSFNTAAKSYENELKKLGTKIEELGSDLVVIANAYATYNETVATEAGKL